jgi:predicted XRE-type DNA-binding protein
MKLKTTKHVDADGNPYEVTESSGNVFADLGLSNPEERLAKAQLATQIANVLAKKGLTQAAAGKLLRISQPRVSGLLRGRLADFSTETLMKYLNMLGSDVELVVRNHPRAKGPGRLQVRCA